LSRKIFWDLAEPHVIIQKNIKFWKYVGIIPKCIKSCHFQSKLVEFEKSTFLLRSVDFLELELF
jgi:hypothetical protein